MRTLRECFDEQAAANRAAIDGRALKFTFKGFSHGTSCTVVSAVAKLEGKKGDFDGGVCLGLALAFLGHRRLKDRAIAGAIAGRPDDAVADEYLADHEKIFGAIYDGLSTKFRKFMSPAAAGEAVARRAHRPVLNAMLLQDRRVAEKVFLSNPRLNAECDQLLADAEALRGQRDALPAGDPLRLDLGHTAATKERAAERLLQDLEAFNTKRNRDMYADMGRVFLPDVPLDRSPVVFNAGVPWDRVAKFDGSAHAVGYHLIDLTDHALAMTVNHAARTFKFFEPNEGVVAASRFDVFAATVWEYVKGMDRRYDPEVWSWFG